MRDPLTVEVGRGLRGAATTAGLNQEDVAKVTGISLVQVQKKFTGRSPITVPELVAFARAANVDPAKIVAEAEDRVKNAALSSVPDNVTTLPVSPEEATAEWADEYKGPMAADKYDPEADQESGNDN